MPNIQYVKKACSCGVYPEGRGLVIVFKLGTEHGLRTRSSEWVVTHLFGYQGCGKDVPRHQLKGDYSQMVFCAEMK